VQLRAGPVTCILRQVTPPAVATAVLLASRERLHGWVRSISWPELRSVLVLAAMTFIALPIMPQRANRTFRRREPREVWIIAIVLAAVAP
jgi:uncharacterized membrane protein (DUF4010 family)